MTHSEITNLLPWYVNATLRDREQREIEDHLAKCASCAREVDELKAICAAMLELAEEAPEPPPDLIQRGLEQVEAYERQKVPESLLGRLQIVRRDIRELWAVWWRPIPGFAQAVIAVQVVLVIGLAGAISVLWQENDKYTTLSGPAITRSQESKARINVGFRENVSEKAIRQIILKIEGTIVAGPSSLGVYVIAVPFSPDETRKLDDILDKLRENRDVVQFAERKP